MSQRLWKCAGLSLLFGVLATLALAGCGLNSLVGAQPTQTPDAQTILRRAQAVRINDLSFALALNSSFSGIEATGNGNGSYTKSPQRFEIGLSLNNEGTSFALQEIADVASSTSYTKIAGLNLPGVQRRQVDKGLAEQHAGPT